MTHSYGLRTILSYFSLACLIAIGAQAAVAAEPVVDAPANSVDPRAEAQRAQRLEQAIEQIQNGHLAQGMALLDALIADYETLYPAGARRYYCARTASETLFYLTGAATAMNKSRAGAPADAVALGPTWADAYYFKAYVLIEQKRISQAKAMLQKALALSPANPVFLSEMAFVAQSEKDWNGMLALAEEAARSTEFASPADAKVAERGRALRNQGYALVELGRLDEAEAIYRQCLELDPDDRRAQAELDFVLKAKQQQAR